MTRPRPARLAALLIVAMLFLLALPAGAQPEGRDPLRPQDLAVPEGFELRVVADGLDFPSSVAWDEDGRLYVGTSGWAYGLKDPLPAQVLRLEPNGTMRVVADGFDTPLTDITWHDGWLYVSHRGAITRLDPATGAREDVVTDLPSFGDHHNNEIVFGADGRLYVGQGTTTNSGVVGLDNLHTGWIVNISEGSDIPCEDVALAGVNYVTDNPWRGASVRRHFERAERVLYAEEDDIPAGARGVEGSNVTTGAYLPFGTPAFRGQLVEGRVPCSGAILAMEPDGSGLDWFAWGLRNPYGLKFGEDGTLWVAENMYDLRGSRPLHGTPDLFRPVEEGAWYGWPDHWTDVPVNQERFDLPNGTIPVLVLAEPQDPVAAPTVSLGEHGEHAGVTKFDFAPGDPWGNATRVYLAAFGDMTPVTGLPDEHYGMAIYRFDARTPASVDVFLAAKDRFGGDFRPVEAAFGPDDRLYVVQLGRMPVVTPPGDAPPHPDPHAGTGAIYALQPTQAPRATTPVEEPPLPRAPDEAREDEGVPLGAWVPLLATLAAALLLARRR